ncbi:hypothetical protein CDAR_320401 [Caerostris darwini]|uniref:Uncharacterized protein n=1 Tax=Caerostris darwini TaxID=1538125 RepID=A0AAV4TMV7_9ARAC|nr:hypothetical protein CDAR_320401 [Caerostris darwini]
MPRYSEEATLTEQIRITTAAASHQITAVTIVRLCIPIVFSPEIESFANAWPLTPNLLLIPESEELFITLSGPDKANRDWENKWSEKEILKAKLNAAGKVDHHQTSKMAVQIPGEVRLPSILKAHQKQNVSEFVLKDLPSVLFLCCVKWWRSGLISNNSVIYR